MSEQASCPTTDLVPGMPLPGRKGPLRGLASVITVFILISHCGRAEETQKLAVPVEYADRFGSDSFQFRMLQFQQVYGFSQFEGISEPQIAIQGIGFRWAPGSDSLQTVIPAIEIHMSTSFKQLWQMTGVRGDNRGQDYKLVYTRTDLPINVVPAGTPSEYGSVFMFDEPFVYDRNSGQLVLDFDVFGEIPGGTEIGYDAHYFDSGRLIFGFGDPPLSGGFATEFYFVPVPEPSPLAIGLSGIVVFINWRRRGARKLKARVGF